MRHGVVVQEPESVGIAMVELPIGACCIHFESDVYIKTNKGCVRISDGWIAPEGDVSRVRILKPGTTITITV